MMNLEQLLAQAANGNQSALVFMREYLDLAHRIDDVIDVADVTHEFVLRTFMQVIALFSLNDFYVKNRELLFPVVMSTLNSYATSVQWEKSEDEAQLRMADHLRSEGTRLLEVVALLCGGIERMRDISPLLAESSWHRHHDKAGNPH